MFYSPLSSKPATKIERVGDRLRQLLSDSIEAVYLNVDYTKEKEEIGIQSTFHSLYDYFYCGTWRQNTVSHNAFCC